MIKVSNLYMGIFSYKDGKKQTIYGTFDKCLVRSCMIRAGEGAYNQYNFIVYMQHHDHRDYSLVLLVSYSVSGIAFIAKTA